QTNHAHLSRRQPEFMPTQPEPNDHVRKADGFSIQSMQVSSMRTTNFIETGHVLVSRLGRSGPGLK
ncbi:hypothetical protein, partial [Streptomyces mirabilis]